MRLRVLLLVLLLSACSQDAADIGEAGSEIAAPIPPNILLIVADDLGYSDVGAFGGEISTPNLDDLAKKGMVLKNFYTAPTCSVSRSMLISGTDNHVAGLGNMAETLADNQLGAPGYEGHLNNSVDTIAEVLGSAGYHTYMAGKWHLGMQPGQSPSSRGFEKSFALLYGGGSHFDITGPDEHRDPALYRDNGRLIDELPDDFYSTSFYTDTVISQIDSNIDDGKPFFAYLAYTAPHWPLQAPDEYLEKYRGHYNSGYDVIRESRFERQKTLALFPATTASPPRPRYLKPWDELTPEEQRFHAGNMETYAAMVDHMDMSIGRVVDYLSEQGELNNTVIVFISDNGADHWDYDSAPPPVGRYAATFDNSPDNRGRKGSFGFYGSEWAHVSNTPFTHYKGSTYEGGIRSPAIIHWPEGIAEGQSSAALTAITDWYSTFASLAGAQAGNASGKNLLPLLKGDCDNVRRDGEAIGIEAWGKRGVVGQRFKLVSSPAKPHGTADWSLYDLLHDPSEQSDIAADNPERLAEMLQQWDEYQAEYNVILPEGPFKVRPVGDKPTE